MNWGVGEGFALLLIACLHVWSIIGLVTQRWVHPWISVDTRKGTQTESGSTWICIQKNKGQILTLHLIRNSEDMGGGIYEIFMSEIMESRHRVRFIRKMLWAAMRVTKERNREQPKSCREASQGSWSTEGSPMGSIVYVLEYFTTEQIFIYLLSTNLGKL